jgi:prepilin-type processing-associated H-X9-DG protein
MRRNTVERVKTRWKRIGERMGCQQSIRENVPLTIQALMNVLFADGSE